MKYNQYFDEINAFKKKYYPRNEVDFDTNEYRGLIYILNENILLCEILESYSSTINIGYKEQGTGIVNTIKNCFSRYTIALMNNDEYYISFLTRVISELFLKLILVQLTTDTNLDVKKQQYRFLNKKLNELSFSNDEKILLNNLRNYYGTYSDIIHTSKDSGMNTINYLTDIVSQHKLKLKKHTNENKTFNDTFYQLIFKNAGLSYDRFGSVEIARLSESMNQDKFYEIKEQLNKQKVSEKSV